jgi:DNA-directed RNA polymerase sigma subunit (sigma70/sigma32)
MKKYKTKKLKQKAFSEIKWEQRIVIKMLKELQGMSDIEIGKRFGLTRQRVNQILRSMKDKTIQELEQMYHDYLFTNDKK